MALIVEDKPGDVPSEVENAEEVVLVVQLFDIAEFEEKIKPRSGDQLFDVVPKNSIGDKFLLVNGQFMPKLTITAGVWQRWRVVFASWDKTPLDLVMDSSGDCEMYLLAKDGIYISDYPRQIDLYPIGSGGRADIMVRCGDVGTYTVTDYNGDLFTVESVSPGGAIDVSTPPTTGFQFPEPDYLKDLTGTSAPSACTCDTLLDSDQLNEISFEPNLYLHTVELGSVVERDLDGVDSHPYHRK